LKCFTPNARRTSCTVFSVAASSPASINEDRHLFCAKEAVLNFVDETKPVKKTNTILEAMPGTEDEPIAREDEATPMPTISSDVMATILTRILDRQDEQAKQMEMLAEIIRVAALKGRI
jgi:hypothetical protein